MSTLPINAFWGFVVCDQQSKLPVYSQYNFNFDYKPNIQWQI